MTSVDPVAARVFAFSQGLRRQMPEEEHNFNQLEAQVADWQKRFTRFRAIADHEQRRFVDTGANTARRRISLLLAAVSIRLIDLSSSLILLVNEGHAHGAFAAARAVFESAGVPAYLDQHVMTRVAKGQAKPVADTIRRLTSGVDPGIDLQNEAPGDYPQPIRVSSLVGALCAEVDKLDPEQVGTMKRTYSNLSDYVHPNYSAHSLSATIDEAGMRWFRPRLIESGLLIELFVPAYMSLHFGGVAADRVRDSAKKHFLVLPPAV